MKKSGRHRSPPLDRKGERIPFPKDNLEGSVQHSLEVFRHRYREELTKPHKPRSR
jgi:hypothetical protein